MPATPPVPAPAETPRAAGDRTAFLAVLGLALGTVVLAAALPAARVGPPSTPAAFRDDVTCLEWTDDCIVCRRAEGGPACSTPGIACERRAPRCLRRAGS